MTTEQRAFARRVLEHEDRVFVLTALSYVNLGDEELDVLVYRYMRQHTQEETAERFDRSVNHIYSVQQTAIEKCYKVWSRLAFVKAVISTTQ